MLALCLNGIILMKTFIATFGMLILVYSEEFCSFKTIYRILIVLKYFMFRRQKYMYYSKYYPTRGN